MSVAQIVRPHPEKLLTSLIMARKTFLDPNLFLGQKFLQPDFIQIKQTFPTNRFLRQNFLADFPETEIFIAQKQKKLN